ncbi:MAG: hypothetical protein F9B45_14575 [Phycisphaera sp. RhM]|nr:hypothetical protein [Phycisphaera sp. RhM]
MLMIDHTRKRTRLSARPSTMALAHFITHARDLQGLILNSRHRSASKPPRATFHRPGQSLRAGTLGGDPFRRSRQHPPTIRAFHGRLRRRND